MLGLGLMRCRAYGLRVVLESWLWMMISSHGFSVLGFRVWGHPRPLTA